MRIQAFSGAVAVSVLLAVSPVHAQDKGALAIGTGFQTGVYYPLGQGIATVVTRYVPGYTAKVEATGGSVDNLKLLSTKRIDIAFSMADATLDAYTGSDKFKSGKLPVRALMVMYPNPLHVVALDRTDINRIADLKGKRVATGAPGSATEVIALRVLDALGLDKDKDLLSRERLSLDESAAALKDKKIDAFFWTGGVPTGAITALAGTPNVKLKLIDHDEAVDGMVKKFGKLYSKQEISAQAYPGMAKGARVAAVWNILVADESMNPKLAYTLVKAIFDNKSELVRAHREALHLSLDNQRADTSPIPFHPGAQKYFAEKGVKAR